MLLYQLVRRVLRSEFCPCPQGATQPIRDTCMYCCDDMSCQSSCQNVCPCTCSVTTHAHRDAENIEEEDKDDEHSEPF